MKFSNLTGKTMKSVKRSDNNSEDMITFITMDDEKYVMHHHSDCCESVNIEDINGDLSDLENTPILLAEENSNSSETDWGSQTYTFYHIRTMKGTVSIRWHGSSNGYYSEGVSLCNKEDTYCHVVEND